MNIFLHCWKLAAGHTENYITIIRPLFQCLIVYFQQLEIKKIEKVSPFNLEFYRHSMNFHINSYPGIAAPVMSSPRC